MQDGLESVVFWIVAVLVGLMVIVGASEWSRARQFRENLKANGRRK